MATSGTGAVAALRPRRITLPARRRARLLATLLAGIAIGAALAVPATAADGVPVPRIAIYPGDAIAAAVIEERPVKLAAGSEAAFALSRAQLVGKIARRTLLPGQPIPLGWIKEPDVVRAGKPVTLVFSAGGLTITARGTAMQAGGVGDAISVQNQDSGRVVRGVVSPDGNVQVGE